MAGTARATTARQIPPEARLTTNRPLCGAATCLTRSERRCSYHCSARRVGIGCRRAHESARPSRVSRIGSPDGTPPPRHAERTAIVTNVFDRLRRRVLGDPRVRPPPRRFRTCTASRDLHRRGHGDRRHRAAIDGHLRPECVGARWGDYCRLRYSAPKTRVVTFTATVARPAATALRCNATNGTSAMANHRDDERATS